MNGSSIGSDSESEGNSNGGDVNMQSAAYKNKGGAPKGPEWNTVADLGDGTFQCYSCDEIIENKRRKVSVVRTHIKKCAGHEEYVKNASGSSGAHKSSHNPAIAGASLQHFKNIWNSIVREEQLQADDPPSIWRLNGPVSWGSDGVFELVIRDDWIKLRDFVLEHTPATPICMALNGKSGRGKTSFLRYLIFYIILAAKERKKAVGRTSTTAQLVEHLVNPIIVYVERSGEAHYITASGVCKPHSEQAPPHYYFSDGNDILGGAYCGSCVTVALSSEAGQLPEFTKRLSEVGGATVYMPSLSPEDMTTLFQRQFSTEEVTFRYGVIGGNPRYFRDASVADPSQAVYKKVQGTVEALLEAETAARKRWVVNLLSQALEEASNTHDRANSPHSGLFRDFTVSGEHCTEHQEVFATSFLRKVTAILLEGADEFLKASLTRLIGNAGYCCSLQDKEKNDAKKRKR